jgi:hypothetical protein
LTRVGAKRCGGAEQDDGVVVCDHYFEVQDSITQQMDGRSGRGAPYGPGLSSPSPTAMIKA